MDLLCLAALIWLPTAAAEVPIAGDRAALLRVRAFSENHEAAYRRGRIEAEVEEGFADAVAPTRKTRVLTVFDRDRSAVTVRVTHDSRDPRIAVSGPAGFTEAELREPVDDEYRYILDREKMITIRGGRHVLIAKRDEQFIPMLTSVRPDQWWFGRQSGQGIARHESLALDGLVVRKRIESLDVARKDDGRVDILRTDTDGATIRFVASAEDGWTREIEVRDRRGKVAERIEYRWGRDRRGRPMLEQASSVSPSDRGDFVRTYRLVEYDSDHVPKASDFSLNLGSLPAGSTVDDRIKGRRYRVKGAGRAESIEDGLDALGAKARASGFARPGR